MKKHPCYSNYGGRGITVCEEWRNNSTAFGDWAITHGYAENLTLDRKDNDKGYSPDNCRWATRKEQAENRRTYPEGVNRGKSNRRNKSLIEINGESKTREEWCDFYGI